MMYSHIAGNTGRTTVRLPIHLGMHVYGLAKGRSFTFGDWWSGRFILVGPGILGLSWGMCRLVVYWLSSSMRVAGLPMDSCASFLAVAEHKLIPAGATSVGHQLRKADRQSVSAPACQDQISGGVGVTGLCGAILSAPSLVTAELREFFWLGRAMSVIRLI